MADLQAAKRYAQAAFAIAREQGTIAQWRAELDDVASLLAESDAAPVLAAGRIAIADRQAMVDRALDVSPLAKNLAKVLVAKGRTQDARDVERAFARLADEAEGIAHVQITTAVQLTAEQVQAMGDRLGQAIDKRVTASASVDPDIIGGVVLRIDDHLIDGSVRTRLRRMRRDLAAAR